MVTGCNSLQTRDEIGRKQGQPPSPTRPTAPPTFATPAPVHEEPQAQSTPVPPTQTTAPTPAPLPPIPKNKSKVGLILGPGGMKAFAHLGVLREMNRARIPVHAIVGLEWGAVMGAVYAHQGQINDAEWKAYKLRDENLPEAGFLQSKASAASISKLGSFLEAAFGATTVQSARIPFACAASQKAGERTQILNRGSFRDVVGKCVPYPPLYQDNGGWLASPFAIEEAAAQLRAQGANVIVLVDVLGQGEYLPSKSSGDLSTENLLWIEMRREMYRAKSPLVQHVIHVNTSGHPVTDFEGRRTLMDAGQKAATDVVNKMVSQYGY